MYCERKFEMKEVNVERLNFVYLYLLFVYSFNLYDR